MKFVFLITGILIATVGGVIAYRALFLEPSSAVVITSTEVRELPNYTKIVGGAFLLVIGFIVAFLGIRSRR